MTSKVWIRILCLALCLTVLLPCVSSLAETTKVAAYLLRLREKPSDTAKVLDAYPRGTKVTILQKGDEWTKVRVHGKVGYMRSNRLAYKRYKTTDDKKSSESSDSSGKKTTVSSGTTAYVIKDVRVNLREEPNSSSAIIASFRGGTKVTILKKGKYFSLVEVKGLQGYMGTDYLTTEKEK